MEKKQEYFKTKELEDYKALIQFNEDIMHLQLLGQTPPMHHTDASGITKDNRYFNIEIKSRDMKVVEDFKVIGENWKNCSDKLMIESHKLADMIVDMVVEKKDPIYINFIADYNFVYVFNLSKLKHRLTKSANPIPTKNDGYKCFEKNVKFFLSISDATIYKKINNKYQLIKRPQ